MKFYFSIFFIHILLSATAQQTVRTKTLVSSGEEEQKPVLTLVKKMNHYALCNKKDSIFFDNIDSVTVDEIYSTKHFIIKQNNKWGMVSEHAKICIPIQFDLIERIYKSYFMVSKNKKYGVYSFNKIIVPCEQDRIVASYKPGADFLFKKNNFWGIFKDNGIQLVPNIYDTIFHRCSIISLRKGTQNSYFINKKVISFDSLATCNLITRQKNVWTKYYKIRTKGKWGVADHKLNYVIKPDFQDLVFRQSDDLFLIKKNNKWGISTFESMIVEPIIHDSIFSFDKYIIVQDKGLMRLYDLKSRAILKNTVFDKIKYRSSLYYAISLDNHTTLIDSALNMVFPLIYDNISHLENNLFSFEIDNKKGLITSENKILIPAEYDFLYVYNNLVFVRLYGKDGILTLDNRILLPIKYTVVDPEDNWIEVRSNFADKVIKLDYNMKCIENCEGFEIKK